MLRRNPTEAERILWDALTQDRRFATYGFKRQTPIGRHIADMVSFPLRFVVDLVPDDESGEAKRTRAERLAWLEERGYRVMQIAVRELEDSADAVLDRLDAELCARAAGS